MKSQHNEILHMHDNYPIWGRKGTVTIASIINNTDKDKCCRELQMASHAWTNIILSIFTGCHCM